MMKPEKVTKIPRHRTSQIISNIDSVDLMDNKGRMEALSVIAKICISGYEDEALSPKSPTPVTLIRKDPSTAVRAILAIAKLSDEQPPEAITVNILKS